MHTGKAPVVVVGSINIDLVANTDRIPVEGETVLPEARVRTRRLPSHGWAIR
jgi:hypothetical protein